jgi:hypothetical protein
MVNESFPSAEKCEIRKGLEYGDMQKPPDSLISNPDTAPRWFLICS